MKTTASDNTNWIYQKMRLQMMINGANTTLHTHFLLAMNNTHFIIDGGIGSKVPDKEIIVNNNFRLRDGMNSMRMMAQKGSEDGAKGQYQQDEYTNEYCAGKCPSSDLLLLMLLMNHFHCLGHRLKGLRSSHFPGHQQPQMTTLNYCYRISSFIRDD